MKMAIFSLLMNYYENGDIFDYLEKLEENQFNFTEDFYWDLIFEMIMGLLFVHECGYIHTDIQPGNYLVDANGYLKLSDFSLALKKSELPFLDDIIEGDARYISKELFHFDKNSKINEKSDVFSLGLTLLELIAKIELPYNGELWHKLRDENFKITDNFFEKCNIKTKLKTRYEKVICGKYIKSCEIPKFQDNVYMKILNKKSAPSTDIL